MLLRAVRGMRDILPDEAPRWQRLEAAFRARAERYGYGEIRTPLLEPTQLFTHQIGETSDVVEKEMYSFVRHDDALTVRPEGTASVARAYVEHGLAQKEPISKFYYLGPMFRGERPAKGRYRQFHQAGCELFGDPGPLCDAEMIDLVVGFLADVGVTDAYVHVNSLGSGDTRARYRDALRTYFEPMKDALSDDSQRRLDKNPLRILDSKHPKDQEAATNAPRLLDLLTDEDTAHFDELRRQLDALGVRHVVDPRLVRGLDYYCKTLFEVKTDLGDLGAQNTLGGGGRYDGMVQSLGGPAVPAIGFAMGLERILLCMSDEAKAPGPDVYVAVLHPSARVPALVLARDLRARGLVVEVDGRQSKLKAMLKRADALRARTCVMYGDGEIAKGALALKHLATETQEDVSLSDGVSGAAQAIAARVQFPPPPAPPGGQDEAIR